ncbi:hypothetical protein PHISCL_07380 [Aspergillus sclerotialis]|uniref:Uncharacterized protein n=1 Tax=Aspergillus sclerotialis TaxID=2070753 RepID=A0A3A2ZQV9_9EURO|nr:hypothetical protein PHISCL_07380 [Aspergillus sclerotialis]
MRSLASLGLITGLLAALSVNGAPNGEVVRSEQPHFSQDWLDALAQSTELYTPPDEDDGTAVEALAAQQRVNFNFRNAAFLLAGYGLTRGSENVKGMVANCRSKDFKEQGECAKHAVEAASALTFVWLGSSGVNGRQAVEVSQGVMNVMNELTGNQVKRDSCPVHEVSTDADLKVNFGDTVFGVMVSCESGCEVSQAGSTMSEVLGQMANFVINRQLQDVQFTVTLPNKRTVARCNIFFPGQYINDICPRKITGSGCQTHINA